MNGEQGEMQKRAVMEERKEGAELQEPTEVVMTEEAIAIWCKSYSLVHQRAHLKKMMSKESHRFIPLLADLFMAAGSPARMQKKYNVLYKWKYVFEMDVVMDGDQKHVANLMPTLMEQVEEEEICLPPGWRLMLQLKYNDKWIDWIYIKQSNRTGANLGVFAGRDFPRKSFIGYYCGEASWTGKVPGGKKPKDEFWDAAKVMESVHSLPIRNKKCCWQVLDARPISPNGGQKLFMGMHYLNSATKSFVPKTTEHESAKKYQNCRLLQDGSVVAQKKIPRNSELLTAYSADEGKLEKEESSEEDESEEEERDDQMQRNMKRVRK